MLNLLLIWIVCFSVLFFAGLGSNLLLQKLFYIQAKVKTSDIIFLGIASISLLTGFLSIFVPINQSLLPYISFFFLLSLFINPKEIKLFFIKKKSISYKKIIPFLINSIISFLLIMIAARGIFNYDTGLYHAQSIQWIQNYSVVPGLGNLHGRLAFNSMFFPLSALFTFDLSDIATTPSTLIYPINGVAISVLLYQFISNTFKYIFQKEWNKAIFFIVLIYLCLYYFPNWISSPSPDIICGITTLYLLTYFTHIEYKKNNLYHLLFTSIIVFTCISFKLSYVFLATILFLFLSKKNIWNFLSITIITGIIVLSPFLIRNYYLSGYLVYPFPHLDIFSPEWKININKVINEKGWIESWAKIPKRHYKEVVAMSITEWFPIWYQNKAPLMKYILVLNISSIISIIISYIKKSNIFIFIQVCIIINLIFWFLNAPDPRFVYGFLFFGTACTISIILPWVKHWSKVNTSICLFLFLAAIYYPIYNQKETLLTVWNTSHNQLFPTALSTVTTKSIMTDFTYYKPINGDRCFNTPIPCTPYPNKKLVLRGEDINEGFKINGAKK